MSATPNMGRSFFSITAWYGLFAPIVVASIVGVGFLLGITDRLPPSPEQYMFGTVSCVLISSALASMVCLFGISKHGWRSIVWKSVLGLVLSFVAFMIVFSVFVPILSDIAD
jgi:hypothetical protein